MKKTVIAAIVAIFLIAFVPLFVLKDDEFGGSDDAGSVVVEEDVYKRQDYDCARKAMELGVNHVTHLYNAMPPFAHRDPGVIGAACDSEDCMVCLLYTSRDR